MFDCIIKLHPLLLQIMWWIKQIEFLSNMSHLLLPYWITCIRLWAGDLHSLDKEENMAIQVPVTFKAISPYWKTAQEYVPNKVWAWESENADVWNRAPDTFFKIFIKQTNS